MNGNTFNMYSYIEDILKMLQYFEEKCPGQPKLDAESLADGEARLLILLFGIPEKSREHLILPFIDKYMKRYPNLVELGIKGDDVIVACAGFVDPHRVVSLKRTVQDVVDLTILRHSESRNRELHKILEWVK